MYIQTVIKFHTMAGHGQGHNIILPLKKYQLAWSCASIIFYISILAMLVALPDLKTGLTKLG